MKTKQSKIERITRKNAIKEAKARLKTSKKKAKACLKTYLKTLKKGKGLVEQTFYCANAKTVFSILRNKTFDGEVLLIDNETIIITNKKHLKRKK